MRDLTTWSETQLAGEAESLIAGARVGEANADDGVPGPSAEELLARVALLEAEVARRRGGK